MTSWCNSLLKLLGMVKNLKIFSTKNMELSSTQYKVWNNFLDKLYNFLNISYLYKYLNLLFGAKCRCNVYENIEISSPCKFLANFM